MLPSGKFPRAAIAVALAVLGLLIIDLRYETSAQRSLLHSNALDLAMVSWAAVCSFYAARRATGYMRQLWVLLGFGLALESSAQLISTYYQSFVPGAASLPWPSDVLFFIWPAPVFAMFLPQPEARTGEVNWQRVLDYAQVGIVSLTAYLYFFYIPTQWESEGNRLVTEVLILYMIRDAVLGSCFLVRAVTAESRLMRRFSWTMSAVFAATTASHLSYALTLKMPSGAHWMDVLWAMPYAIVAIVAGGWRAGEEVLGQEASSRWSELVMSHILPIGLPLAVIFMGRRIAQEQVAVAMLAVTASFLCSALRLILTNRNLQRTGEELRGTEKALRLSERMFATAFRSTPDSCSISLFPDGTYVEVNDGFTRLTGYSREEALGKTPLEMNLWADLGQRPGVMTQLAEKGEIEGAEFRFRKKTGEVRTGQYSGAVVELDGQRCVLTVVRDITARKEAEEILRTSEEKFRMLVENLHVGILLFDPERRILFANKAAMEPFEVRLDQLVGKSAAEMGLRVIREDGKEIPEASWPGSVVMASKRPYRSQVIGIQRRGGEKIVWTLMDTIPELSAEGEVVRLIVSLTDLSEQRKAAEALRESEERFRTLVQDLHVGVVLGTPEAKIEYANPAALKMFGLQEGFVLGKRVQDLGITPMDEAGRKIAFEKLPGQQVLETGVAVTGRVIGWRQAGSKEVHWIFGNTVPQFDADGKIVRVITTFTDVTELKNAEKALHRLSTQLLKLQDQERRRIGRELHDGLAQTVLAVNLNLAQAREAAVLDKKGEQAFERSRTLLQEMSREIRTLSYLLHPPLLDELGLVSALKEYVHGFAERSGIATRLDVEMTGERLPQAVEMALFRIVQESLANIQRHSGSATATVRLAGSETSVCLEIMDEGCGMNVPQNGASQEKEAHLGVGIPGMRERMAQMGGTLEFESQPGRTTVRARVNLSAGAGTEEAEDAAAPDTSSR